jgi:hypothetical protein
VTHRKALLPVVLLLMLGVGASAAFAGGGNSANAKLCQKTGWQSAETASGGTFASSEDCTSYAAEGGELFMPSIVQHSRVASASTTTGRSRFTPSPSLASIRTAT